MVVPQIMAAKAVFKSPTAKTICTNKSFKVQWEFSPRLNKEIKILTVLLCRHGRELRTMKKMRSTHCCRRTNACCNFNYLFRSDAPYIGPGFTIRVVGFKADNSRVLLGESHTFTISRCKPTIKKKIDPRRKVYKKSPPKVKKKPPALEMALQITDVRVEAIPKQLEVEEANLETKKAFAEAYITVVGKGEVKVEWIAHNRGVSGKQTLIFDKSGTQRVETSWNWQCYKNGLTHNWKKAWFELHIISPQEIRKKVHYEVRCVKNN
jgi:hypothetical protein